MKKSKKIIAFLLALIVCFGIFPASVLTAGAEDAKAEIKSIYCEGNGLKITWNPVPGATEYRVFRWYGSLSEWEFLATVDQPFYLDEKVTSGTQYHYLVDTGNYNFGTDKTVTYVTAPTNVTACASSDGIELTWSGVSGGENYKIFRKTANESYCIIATVNAQKALSYTDKNVKAGTVYYYVLRAVSKNGCESINSAEVSPKIVSLNPPSGVSVKNSPQGVKITWKKNTKPEKYEISRKIEKGKWQTVGTVSSSKKTFIDKKASYGSVCYYRVRSVSGISVSKYSSKKKVFALDPKKPAIALTFDDGPYAPVTNKILDTLEKYNSRATFFVVGSRVSTYKNCIKREAKLGCEVGCHTYNHAILTRLDSASIKKEIKSAVKAIEKYTGGQKVKVVRTPGGAVNDTVKASIKYPLFNWSIDTLDWQHRTTKKSIKKIKANAKDGSIILMHDLYEATGNAAVKIVPWLVDQGYQLVTISELFDLKGIKLKKGKLYNCA